MEGFKGKSEVARILVGCALKVAQSLAFVQVKLEKLG